MKLRNVKTTSKNQTIFLQIFVSIVIAVATGLLLTCVLAVAVNNKIIKYDLVDVITLIFHVLSVFAGGLNIIKQTSKQHVLMAALVFCGYVCVMILLGLIFYGGTFQSLMIRSLFALGGAFGAILVNSLQPKKRVFVRGNYK